MPACCWQEATQMMLRRCLPARRLGWQGGPSLVHSEVQLWHAQAAKP